MATIDEAKEVEQIDEEDELDGWGPVRIRRSSTRVIDAAQASSPASPELEHAQEEPLQPGHPPLPGSDTLLV